MAELLRGKYQIIREIARSNDIVYEATDVSLGRRVAIKELNVAGVLTGQARRERIERFTREARAAGRLSHPNIVSIYDFGEENGRHFIAMEYLDGQTLRDVLQVRKPLPLSEACDIACQVLDALGFAHANGVVHRDIKPENIQVLPGGKVKLTDFGIARLTEEPALTSNGQVFGTPSYMSPEQIEGRSIDYRSDLFSLGVVLYEMLTGRKPFIGDSVVSITYAIMHAEPPTMPGVPTGVEQVVRRALAKQPLQRQASADQLKLDLKAAERTPPAFLTGTLNATGYGMGQIPYSGTLPPYGHTGALPPVLPTVPAQISGTGNTSLPWAWTGAPPGASGQLMQSAPGAPQLPPGYVAAPMPGVPYQQQPMFPARPRPPAIKLSPAQRSFLIAVMVAVGLGAVIAFGIIGFLNSYDHYRVSASTREYADLVQRGVNAYAARDYALAVQQFDRAAGLALNEQERAAVAHNQVAADIQLARVQVAGGRLTDAKALYDRALRIAPLDPVTNADMNALLMRMGSTPQAPSERLPEASAATTEQETQTLHVDVKPPASQSGVPATYDGTAQQILDEHRQRARDLISKGNDLYAHGDTEGARSKWSDAIAEAPGTAERNEAQALLDQTAPKIDITPDQ